MDIADLLGIILVVFLVFLVIKYAVAAGIKASKKDRD